MITLFNYSFVIRAFNNWIQWKCKWSGKVVKIIMEAPFDNFQVSG